MQRGDNEVGPYQSPMEDGMQHFHEWYREKIEIPPAPPAASPPQGGVTSGPAKPVPR